VKYLSLRVPVLALLLAVLPNLAVAQDDEVWDPIEPVNRGIFWFNVQVDNYLLEPVAEGYDYVLPGFMKKGVKNFFRNLQYPQYLLSDLVQLKFEQAGVHTARFLVNSTMGVAGLNDIASYKLGLEHHEEDFGAALGYYGVPGGPYLMLPLLGPSNFRDLVGEIVDGAVYPTSYLDYASVHSATATPINSGLRALSIVSTRARLLEAIKTARESSVDYYGFVKSAHHQRRQATIYDGNAPENVGEPGLTTGQ